MLVSKAFLKHLSSDARWENRFRRIHPYARQITSQYRNALIMLNKYFKKYPANDTVVVQPTFASFIPHTDNVATIRRESSWKKLILTAVRSKHASYMLHNNF
jgi:hypothetical protein